MALTIAQKSAVRRHLGYPVIGLLANSPGGQTLGSAAAGYRYFEAYGFLEWKLNNLNPDEECRLTGRALGAVGLIGPQPNPGDTVSVTLSGGPIPSPQTLIATAPGPDPQHDLRINLCNALAAACAVNQVLQAQKIYSVAPYGTGPFSLNAVALPEVAFSCAAPFTIAAAGSGVLVPQVTADGSQIPPAAAVDGINTVYGYVPILDALESAFAGTSQNLDTMKADVWTARANEIGQRRSLYENWRQMLSDFLGIPINPMRRNNASSVGALRYR